ncbi:MAG TPA: Rne/Rng family ribonuclease [Candidatus Nanopelagicaceae bacterium]|nr:Rne/Rng family ribonuclease [Candidatus Nanopelagicaceae bacterium]
MADLSNTDSTDAPKVATTRRRAATRPAGPPKVSEADQVPVAREIPAAKSTRTARSAKAPKAAPAASESVADQADSSVTDQTTTKPMKKPVRKASAKKPAKAGSKAESESQSTEARLNQTDTQPTVSKATAVSSLAPIFQAPVAIPAAEDVEEPKRAPRQAAKSASGEGKSANRKPVVKAEVKDSSEDLSEHGDIPGERLSEEEIAKRRRRRRRGGRGRRRTGREVAESLDLTESDVEDEAEDSEAEVEESGNEDSTTAHRRRRRRRSTGEDIEGEIIDADGVKTVVKVRDAKTAQRSKRDEDDTHSSGSTRLEAKKARRRDSRDPVRRRAPIITEAQFLARRESVDRQMLVRQSGDRTQIAVIEDKILVEHYVNRASNTSYVGNIYLGKVQNVLPSMEAAFVDIGKGRNAVLYAGEVNWDAAGLADGTPKRIETALKTGQNVLVQVTKDPIGQKGARLTSQVSLPGRYLVYVPGGGMSGISRKLPDTERSRLKQILKQLVPEDAGVIVRTAAEGVSEEEMTRDVNRLRAQWEDIEQKTAAAVSANGSAPVLVYGEPDLTVRVIRDIFNEDFRQLTVQGDEAWDEVNAYLGHIAADLVGKLSHWTSERDLFAEYRVEEQLAKALDRKVYLPSGGSLVIDRTEAMVVVDVNTGKFTGKGGNLEETVTKNNLEAAEEIARQLRLRDLGGIIVIDFIDMVLESNRDQVLRRLTECLGRDRTKHQVAEVTSLGLIQMTRKRIGQGLLEAFSTPCEVCHGRGVLVQMAPVDQNQGARRHRHFEHRVDTVGDEETATPSPSASIASMAAVAASKNRPTADQTTEPEPAVGTDTETDTGADAEPELVETPVVAKKGRRRVSKKAVSAKKSVPTKKSS